MKMEELKVGDVVVAPSGREYVVVRLKQHVAGTVALLRGEYPTLARVALVAGTVQNAERFDQTALDGFTFK